MGKWLARNSMNLLVAGLFAALMIYLLKGKSGVEIWNSIKSVGLVIIGLGLVIFIHELGHFLAAKACNVRVEAFSLGFGPPIPGCHFKYGETEYKIALFPIGGYVKMMGEDAAMAAIEGGQSEEEGSEKDSEPAEPPVAPADDPRSFRNKSVGQRMIIISAGVIMNILLALVCFVYVYHTGKWEKAPRIGTIEPGSPADLAGMEAGSRLLRVNDSENPTFEDLFYASAFSSPGSTQIYFKWETPRGEIREANVTSRKKKMDSKPVIGVGFPYGLVVPKMDTAFAKRLARSRPPGIEQFKDGGKIVGIREAGAKEFTPLKDGWNLNQQEYNLRGKPVEYLVDRDDTQVVIPMGSRNYRSLGIRPTLGPIVHVHAYRPEAAKAFQVGDQIIAVNGDTKLDPIQLPDLLAQKTADGKPVEITVKRNGGEKKITIPANVIAARGTLNEVHPSFAGQMSVAALGITYDISPVVSSVGFPGSDPSADAALQAIRPGDIVEAVTFYDPEDDLKNTVTISELSWAGVFIDLQGSPRGTQAEIKLRRDDLEYTVNVTPRDDPTWPHVDRGIPREYEMTLVTTDDLGLAMSLGVRDTVRWIGRIYLNLKSLITGDISVKLISGPVEMVKVTYAVAERSFGELILLLGIININLAVVNFLPIPILDGGHMVFLIVEKIRRKPVSERTLIIANTIGLGFIICLMLFVLVLDFSKMEWVRRLFQF